MNLFTIFLITLVLFGHTAVAQPATITETPMEFTTYPFSDPDPVPEMGRIYPYFSFDGYTNTPVQQEWNMVILENEYIQVYVCPEIGGKVWGAVEKSTGLEFLYFNHVVKFRDVAMRGPWTSGGLEYNFGDIGHIPTCATPVDYTTAEHPDGSVTCTVGAIDLPSGTRWNVEIRVSPGKAFFETRASWFNTTALPCTYYHWMNAAAKASDDLEFLYPGSHRIGHGGEPGPWPAEDNRNLAWYRNNDFGSYKSYHVINAYAGYFGGYWHNSDFGFGRYGDFDEKPGKKLWIWGLSDEGMIWEDLLTDADGQYIEYQAGKLFNQAAAGSTATPFKHREFMPHDADVMHEYWFPLKGTGGMVAASPFGVLNMEQKGDQRVLTLGALQALDDDLQVSVNGEVRHLLPLKLQPLELFTMEVTAKEEDEVTVVVGDHKLDYSTAPGSVLTDRPVEPNDEFDRSTAYGRYTLGLEHEKQRAYAEAEMEYRAALELDPGFLPALTRMALACHRRMDDDSALTFVRKALAIDTYDGEANYLLGLVCRATGDRTTAKSGFAVAMGSTAWRSAAATGLAGMSLEERDWRQAERYARKALTYNNFNFDALRTLAVAQRKSGDTDGAAATLTILSNLDATDPFHRFEAWLLSGRAADSLAFVSHITSELPHESFLDLAVDYYRKGCHDEAATVLATAPPHPVVAIWLAHLDREQGDAWLDRALAAPCDLVFPHRRETATVIEGLLTLHPHWKLRYYLGLIYWHQGRVGEAREQFAACGDRPGFAPFYQVMARLSESPGEQQRHLETALALAPTDWRAALSLSDSYRALGNPDGALQVIRPFLMSCPERPAVGLAYARSLEALGEYEEAVAFLESYTVLPFEGATAARDLYHEACLRTAMEALQDDDHDRAITYAEKARAWPVNLGSGRPYDPDERFEDHLLYRACSAKGDSNRAAVYAARVMDHEHPRDKQENCLFYLQLDLLMKNGRQEEAEDLIDEFTALLPGNAYQLWAALKAAGDEAGASGIEQEIMAGSDKDRPRLEPRYRDKTFPLLLDYLEME